MSQSGSQQELGHLAKGDVVQVPIPFPDKEGESKVRPALILMRSQDDRFVVCPITSSANRQHRIPVERKHFKTGHLDSYDASYLRPNILHTIDRKYIIKKYGTLKDEMINDVIAKMISLLNQPPEPKPVLSKALERPPAPKKVR